MYFVQNNQTVNNLKNQLIEISLSIGFEHVSFHQFESLSIPTTQNYICPLNGQESLSAHQIMQDAICLSAKNQTSPKLSASLQMEHNGFPDTQLSFCSLSLFLFSLSVFMFVCISKRLWQYVFFPNVDTPTVFLEWHPCHSSAEGFGFYQNNQTIEI